MTSTPTWTEQEIAAFCARIGLTNLDPEAMERLRWNADKVAATGRALPRMPRKDDEPAGIFAVPLKANG